MIFRICVVVGTQAMYATIRINIEVVSYECYDDKLDLAHLHKK